MIKICKPSKEQLINMMRSELRIIYCESSLISNKKWNENYNNFLKDYKLDNVEFNREIKENCVREFPAYTNVIVKINVIITPNITNEIFKNKFIIPLNY